MNFRYSLFSDFVLPNAKPPNGLDNREECECYQSAVRAHFDLVS